MVQNSGSSNSNELTGRRVLLTGGSRGIGAAIARRLTADGAQVVAVARTAPAEPPAAVQFVTGDVRTEAGVQAIAGTALERLGGVDVIVHNAAASRAFPAGSLSISVDEWQDVLDVTLLAAVRINAALLPQML